ncbi:MAG: hypothetical protein KA715_12260 [Xanthomonadaceae bacterium]|nr:hypothetical protein [Xanthomonadaceae bacterium]
MNNPENFLSFGYNDMTDVYIRRYGFCSGYTYVTWVLRYLVTYDPAGAAQSTETMTKLLDQAIFELKPVKFTGVAGLKSLSSLPEVNRYLKLAIGRAWKEQSVGIDGLKVYMGKFQGKKTDWNSLTENTKNYLNQGIYPIMTSVDRNEWKTFGDPEEEGMIHVMPVVGFGPIDMQSEIWSKVSPGLYENMNILMVNSIYNQKQSFKLLDTDGAPDFIYFIEREEQIDVLNLFSLTRYPGDPNITQVSLLKDVYMDMIYYTDRLAAQVALSLVNQ